MPYELLNGFLNWWTNPLKVAMKTLPELLSTASLIRSSSDPNIPPIVNVCSELKPGNLEVHNLTSLAVPSALAEMKYLFSESAFIFVISLECSLKFVS